MTYQTLGNINGVSADWPVFNRESLHKWLRLMIAALLVGVLVNVFFPRYFVRGHSMEPQLYARSMLFVSSLDVLTNQLRRGEMVVFTSPTSGDTVIKRIIGLPGERVDVVYGRVYINGVALNEDYIKSAPTYNGSWIIGPDHYFVLGDNRNESMDSHNYGAVSRVDLRGVVKFRYWPLNGFGVVPVPDYGSLSQ